MTQATVENSKVKIGDGQAPVYDISGKLIEALDLDKKIFDGRINHVLLKQVATMYLARQRQGNASAKTRAEVSGGGKKPWRQKGTGRARFGSTRNPIWKGGGVAFGPKPKDYSYKLPKKMIKEALKSALNAKAVAQSLVIVDKFDLKEPKTKVIADFLKKLNLSKAALIIADHGKNDFVYKSARNIKNIFVADGNSVNSYDLLSAHYALIERSVFEQILKGFSK